MHSACYLQCFTIANSKTILNQDSKAFLIAKPQHKTPHDLGQDLAHNLAQDLAHDLAQDLAHDLAQDLAHKITPSIASISCAKRINMIKHLFFLNIFGSPNKKVQI